MSYSLAFSASLGLGKTGLSFTLRAQVVDASGLNIGSAQSGFTEIGVSGNYIVSLTIADAQVGGIKVYDTGSAATILAFVAINPVETELAALIDMTNSVETGLTIRQAFRLFAAALGGKLSGAGTGTEVFRNAVADSKARVTASIDPSYNRTAVVVDLT